MKITIVQSEIETAIEDFLRQQIDIKDDQEIVIDLSATRGPEGFRAEIDIRKIEAPAQEAPLNVTKTVRAARQPKPSPEMATAEATKAPVTAATVADDIERTRAVVEGNASTEDVHAQEAAQPVAEANQEALAAEVATEPEPAQEATQEAPIATAKPSLFGGLKKPTNTKTAE